MKNLIFKLGWFTVLTVIPLVYYYNKDMLNGYLISYHTIAGLVVALSYTFKQTTSCKNN